MAALEQEPATGIAMRWVGRSLRIALVMSLSASACGGMVGATGGAPDGGFDATTHAGADAGPEAAVDAAAIDVAVDAAMDMAAEATAEGGCVPRMIRCEGTTPSTCNSSGEWVDGNPCPFLCQNGQCVGACQPGSTACDGTFVRSCDPNGQWTDGGACPYVCDAGVCTGSCVPGTTSCCDTNTTPPSCGSNSIYAIGPCSGPFGIALGACDSAGEWTVGPACSTCWTSDGGQDCVVTCQPCIADGSIVATCQVPGDSGIPADVCACP